MPILERRNISASMTTRKHSSKKSFKKAEALDNSWLFGTHAVVEALKNPDRVANRLIATRNSARELPDNLPLEPEILDPKEISGILPQGAVHQGLGLKVEPLAEPDLEDVCANPDPKQPVIVLDQVTDPHNVGAIMRSAAAFGARALITTLRNSPEISGTLAKVASGALEYVPYVRVVNLSEAIVDLQNLGYQVIGLAEEGDVSLGDLAPFGPVAIVVGAEGAGLRHKTRGKCDQLAKLPTQPPIGSLNVSNAAAVAMYEVMRSIG